MQVSSLYSEWQRTFDDAMEILRQSAPSPDAANWLEVEARATATLERLYEIEAKMCATPATLKESTAIKLRIALQYAREDASDGELDPSWRLVESALKDLEAVGQAAAAA